MDYYSILGVNKNASDTELKKAYKKKVAVSSDKGGDANKFQQLNEAYETPKDPKRNQTTIDSAQQIPSTTTGGGQHYEEFNFGNVNDIFDLFSWWRSFRQTETAQKK